MNKLTDKQFSDVQDKIDSLARSTRHGSMEEKAAFSALHSEWEAAYALPSVRFADRQVREAALFAVAKKHGLV